MEGYKIGFVINNNNIRKVLITLLIPNNALTNMNRENIIDKKHAKYRCNNAYVVEIEDNYKNYDSAMSGFYTKKLLYEKNKVIETSFDIDIKNVSSDGIHFFLDLETALNYKEPILRQRWKNERDTYKEYYSNGQVAKIVKYKLDEKDPKTIIYKKIKEYYEDGLNKIEYNLSINKYDGLYQEWYPDGKLKKRIKYDKNRVISIIESYDIRGNKY